MIVRDAESDDGFQPVGVWGCGCPVGSSAVGRSTDRAGRRDQQHLRYIRRKKIGLYTELLTTGKLDSYLADIDRQAEKLFDRLTKQMDAAEGINEKLKASDQMEWVRRMNSINSRAKEIVNYEIINT